MKAKTLISNLKLTLFGCFMIICFVFVLANTALCSEAVLNSLKLVFGFLIPSLYFQIIISSVIYKSAVLRRIPFISAKTEILILGLIGGYTVGSLLTKEALANGEISEKEANALGYSVLCAGPALIIGGIGQKMLHNPLLGVMIYIASALSQIIIYIIIIKRDNNKKKAVKNENFSEIIVSSVNNSTSSIIKLSGFVIIFSSVAYIISNVLNTHFSVFGIDLEKLVSYFFESTYAISDIVSSRSPFALNLIIFFLNFGGFSLLFQVKSNLSKVNLSVFKLFAYKIVISVISILICSLLLKLFPVTENTLSAGIEVATFYSNAPASVFLIAFAVYLLIYPNKNLRKNYH